MTRATLLAAFAILAFAAPAAAQSTYTWAGSGEVGIAPRWLAPAHWTGGTAGQFPGVTASGLAGGGSATDIARFNSFPDGTSNGIGIDFGLAGGQLSLGAIQFTDNLGGPAIGNMSATTAGVLRLNGATVAGIPNVVVASTSFSYSYYIFSALPNSGSGGPGMTIALGGADNVFFSQGSLLHFTVPITEAVAGAGVTVRGYYTNFFNINNSYTGRTRVFGGELNFNRDLGLGLPPAVPTPGHIVLEPDGAEPGTLSTNAATFTIHQNRGIAVGPTSGTGDGVLLVDDGEVEGFLATITYNGVIANNGGGTGRLVKTGGGKLVLGGSSIYTGGTLSRGGELRLTNLNALGTTGTVTLSPFGSTPNLLLPIGASLLVEAGGTFSRPITVAYTGTAARPVTIGTPHFTGASETVFSGAITLDRAATFQGGNALGTRFTGGVSGAGPVTISGTAAARVVTFEGGNFTYTGGTTVASGNLLLLNQTATQSGTGTGAVSVTGGTLGGNGRAAGAVAVASGGRITAGTSLASRRLALGSTLGIAGGRYRVVLFGGGNEEASRLDVTGAVTLSNSPTFELDLNGQTVDGLRAGGPREYTVVTAAGVTGTFAAPDFTATGFDASEWAVSYPGGNQVRLAFTPVPEPVGALVVGVVWVVMRRFGCVLRSLRERNTTTSR